MGENEPHATNIAHGRLSYTLLASMVTMIIVERYGGPVDMMIDITADEAWLMARHQSILVTLMMMMTLLPILVVTKCS